ncbi:hypothetical protein [Enterococcus sp. HY326]|uniref:hypothetical protein n=1 Tax=Enterococcus sp. HY326 TaxID=2971265 RepID=UPI002240C2EA|nr:hypothetical protein [Enterococcus sp. HY326]
MELNNDIYGKRQDILCPNLSEFLNEKEATYTNLYTSFANYCNEMDEELDLCGISLGGILSLNYALDYPGKERTLVLISTPHKVPRVIFSIQNKIFKFLPKSVFQNMAFNKKQPFILGNSMKELDFSSEVKTIKCSTLIICGKKDRANLKSAYYFEGILNGQTRNHGIRWTCCQ